MSQTIISLIHCLQGMIDLTNVTHTWYDTSVSSVQPGVLIHHSSWHFQTIFCNFTFDMNWCTSSLLLKPKTKAATEKQRIHSYQNEMCEFCVKAVPLKRWEATCEYNIFHITLTHNHTHSLPLMQTISQSLAHSLFFFNAHSSLTHTPSLTVSHKLHFSHFHTDTLSIFL